MIPKRINVFPFQVLFGHRDCLEFGFCHHLGYFFNDILENHQLDVSVIRQMVSRTELADPGQVTLTPQNFASESLEN